MFLRSSGSRILILQSYRDGLGRVRQRRLGGFSTGAELERQWGELHQQFPHQRGQLNRLRKKASHMLQTLPPKGQPPRRSREAQLRRHARAMLRLLAQGVHLDPAPEFTALRVRLESEEEGAAEKLAEQRLRQGRPQECADLLSSAPPRDPETATRQAALWAEMGRAEEGLRLLEKLPKSNPWAQINRAALLLRLNKPEQALSCLSKGLALDTTVLPDLEQLRKGRAPQGYWSQFAALWDESGRDFLTRLSKQLLVRWRSAQVREGARFHTLVKARSQIWLLERALGS